MSSSKPDERLSAKDQLYAKSLEYERFEGHKPLALIHSFGCQQNVSDGEKLKGMLSAIGFSFTDEPEKAALIIYNTCAVRENAEDRVFGNLGQLKKLKEKRPELVIGICGCMAQQKHVAEKIKDSYRYVDLVFGTFAYGDFYDMEQKRQKKHHLAYFLKYHRWLFVLFRF